MVPISNTDNRILHSPSPPASFRSTPPLPPSNVSSIPFLYAGATAAWEQQVCHSATPHRPRGFSILVTGAAGFVGTHSSLALPERGDGVLGFDNFHSYFHPSSFGYSSTGHSTTGCSSTCTACCSTCSGSGPSSEQEAKISVAVAVSSKSSGTADGSTSADQRGGLHRLHHLLPKQKVVVHGEGGQELDLWMGSLIL
ncbi:hypothetical protein CsSME_00005498 [Camellia sinensis var. sinensis]